MPRNPSSDAGRAAALATYVRELDPDTVVELLLTAAATSEELTARLYAAMARDTGDVTQLKLELRRLLPTLRYLDWRRTNEYAGTAYDVVPLLTELVDGGQATASIALIEDAFGRINRLLMRADDSSGMLGNIARSLLALHVRACAEGSPDPRKLVKWLIAVGVDDKGGFFNPVVDDIAAALGPAGCRRVSQDHRRTLDQRRRFSLMYAKRGLARVDRDVAALVETTHPGAPAGTHLTEVARELFKNRHARGGSRLRRACDRRPTVDGPRRHRVRPGRSRVRAARRPEEALRLMHEALRRAPTLPRRAMLRRLAEQVGAWPAEQTGARATVSAETNVRSGVRLVEDRLVGEIGQDLGRRCADRGLHAARQARRGVMATAEQRNL